MLLLLRIARLASLSVLVARLPAAGLILASLGFDFISGCVRGFFDCFFALGDLRGEIGVRRGLRDCGRLFGITKHGRVGLRPDKCPLKIDRPYRHPG